MSEALSPVEATGLKTIEVKNKNAVHDALTKLSGQIQEKENLDEKFQAYLRTFSGKANLGMMAEIVNRDLKQAAEGQGDNLARKLGLTTIKKAQEANANLQEQARALAQQTQAQKKTAEAEQLAQSGKPPQTAQAEKPKGISDYVGNSALKRRMEDAGVK